MGKIAEIICKNCPNVSALEIEKKILDYYLKEIEGCLIDNPTKGIHYAFNRGVNSIISKLKGE